MTYWDEHYYVLDAEAYLGGGFGQPIAGAPAVRIADEGTWVHPPLGKMLVGLAGLLAGYDGSFEFKSGEAYPDSVPYVAMRVMMAMFGVGMVPLAWYTAVELGMSQWACHLTAMMVLFGGHFRFALSLSDI